MPLLQGNKSHSWGLYPYDPINYQRPHLLILSHYYGGIICILWWYIQSIAGGSSLSWHQSSCYSATHVLSGGDTRMKKTQFSLKAQKRLLSFCCILGRSHISKITFSLKPFLICNSLTLLFLHLHSPSVFLSQLRHSFFPGAFPDLVPLLTECVTCILLQFSSTLCLSPLKFTISESKFWIKII